MHGLADDERDQGTSEEDEAGGVETVAGLGGHRLLEGADHGLGRVTGELHDRCDTQSECHTLTLVISVTWTPLRAGQPSCG